MPAVLCEVAYINNERDRRKLVDSDFQRRVAQAMCEGLRAYVEGSKTVAQSTSSSNESDADNSTRPDNLTEPVER